MSKKTYEVPAGTEIDVKRFRPVPQAGEFFVSCPDCGINVDVIKWHLSYPRTGPQEHPMYCRHCEYEWVTELVVQISYTVEDA